MECFYQDRTAEAGKGGGASSVSKGPANEDDPHQGAREQDEEAAGTGSRASYKKVGNEPGRLVAERLEGSTVEHRALSGGSDDGFGEA